MCWPTRDLDHSTFQTGGSQAKMIICFSRKFLFIHIHKTAGESIYHSCRKVLQANDIALDGLPKTFNRNNKVYHLDKHSPAQTVLDYLGPTEWESFFSFSVVRNPLSRAVSLYNWSAVLIEQAGLTREKACDLRREGTVTGYEFLRWPSIHVWSETTNFSTFIRHPYLASERAWQPQIESLKGRAGDAPIVSHVLKFENLSDNWAQVAALFGLPELPEVNVSKSRPMALKTSDVSDEDKRYLCEKFALDFKYFGYDLD